MKPFDDAELRDLFAAYTVPEPSPALVNVTRRRMHTELYWLAEAPAPAANWVILLVGLSVAMCLCLFYMLTVGTVLRFVLPAYFMTVVKHSIYAFTAAGGSLVAFGCILLYFKQFHARRPGQVHTGAEVGL